tara:strand:- start:122 stop:544 length:423 start_codon:yes stop_codon:yes gene_type:complete
MSKAVKEKYNKLKNELRAVQRDYRGFLDKTQNKTGTFVREGTDFYNRQIEKTSKKLDAYEKKHKLGSYASEGLRDSDKKKSTKKIKPRGGGGGAILDLGRIGSGTMDMPPKKKLNKGGMIDYRQGGLAYKTVNTGMYRKK